MRTGKKVILAMGAAMLASAVSVSAFSEVSVLLRAASSKVEVHLEEFMQSDGEEIPWTDGQVVLPGTVLSKIPRIYNDGEPCYVRAAVEFESSGNSNQPLSTEHLVGMDQDWVQTEGYFYYKNILQPNKTVDFFQGIQIPADWESGVEDGQTWNAEVKVDAVQAEFFKPDFSDTDPWGLEREGYEIQEAVEEVPENTAADQEKEEKPVKFEIEHQMKGFSVDSREFFRTLEPFVPGESQTGNVELSNQTNQEREVYMRSEIPKENEFLRELELTIQIREQGQVRVIYQGKLPAEELLEYRSIGKVPAKESENVEFIVHLPKEADNRYSVKEGSVKFVFTTDVPEQKNGIVKTGDRDKRWLILGMISSGLCLSGCMYIFWKRFRGRLGGK